MNETTPLHPAITSQLPVARAVVKLFYPFVEGVVHDLESGTIVALYNNLSKRAVGDASAITKFVGDRASEFPDIFEPYYKTNWDGAKFKCTSVTIRDESDRPVGLLCINFNTDALRGVSLEIGRLLAIDDNKSQNPVELFTDDWQARILQCINNYLKENNLKNLTLTTMQKRNLISRLYAHGLFHYRNAVPFIGAQLGLSRATVYKYLKEEKE